MYTGLNVKCLIFVWFYANLDFTTFSQKYETLNLMQNLSSGSQLIHVDGHTCWTKQSIKPNINLFIQVHIAYLQITIPQTNNTRPGGNQYTEANKQQMCLLACHYLADCSHKDIIKEEWWPHMMKHMVRSHIFSKLCGNSKLFWLGLVCWYTTWLTNTGHA